LTEVADFLSGSDVFIDGVAYFLTEVADSWGEIGVFIDGVTRRHGGIRHSLSEVG